MNLFSLPPGVPFLDELACRWLDEFGADPLARGLILLPTRRAARSLAEAFLRASGGRPLLLPRITAIGAIDEAPLTLAGALDLPPAVSPARRLAALSRMILGLPIAQGGVGTADRAWMLAQELAVLMDEAERMEIDLPAALEQAASAEHAAHWQITLQFLGIVTRSWPDWLAENGLANPAARQVALLKAQARAWEDAPLDEPVWIAGTTAGIPAVARLLRVVAENAMGRVVLPGLDHAMDDAAWEDVGDGHPQGGLKALLADLGARREDVAQWAPTPPRAAALSNSLLPARALGAWREGSTPATAGMTRLEAADAQEEAAAIALILRDTLQTPGARAALVTPDRALARRVAAELMRWGVVADDSAGEPLAETPPAVFLRLLAAAIAEDFAPVALLALLKHPLAAAGLDPAACRRAARALEVASLRGPKPRGGIVGLRQAAEGKTEAVGALVLALEQSLAPLLRVLASPEVAPADALAALIAAGEALAATDTAEGPARLWALEEGEALATCMAEALDAFALLPVQPISVLPGLLDAVLEGVAVRSRRALRGREAVAEHPRVFIWGLLEARLQTVDLVVLGGLAEGVWPPATDPGPWLSRPMRTQAGLPSPEERVGQAAHDFVMAACSAPVAVLSCPRRRDGAPSVPARWLVRLEAMLAGAQSSLSRHPAALWARLLDQPGGAPRPVAPPTPRPALGLRPRRLRVTEVQTWLEDPYAIYARHVLGLEKLDPLEEETDAADYGIIVHAGMQLFLAEHGANWPPLAAEKLRACMNRALREARLRPALEEWWAPRLGRIADWVAGEEIRRRGLGAPVRIETERTGRWVLTDLARGTRFELRGRADRIELRADGRLAIFDYKTGQPPSQAVVDAGFAPQLPLEAAMAAAGAFGPELAGAAAELIYWHLTGGYVAGEARSLFKGDAAAVALAGEAVAAELARLVAIYDDPDRPYLAQPHPGRVPRFADYAQLARVAEWTAAGEEA